MRPGPARRVRPGAFKMECPAVDDTILFTCLIVALAVATILWIGRGTVPGARWRKERREIQCDVIRAIALARSGRVANGYEILRTRLRQARDLRDQVGEPWAENLVRVHQAMLDR